jgi:hypothetical protein
MRSALVVTIAVLVAVGLAVLLLRDGSDEDATPAKTPDAYEQEMAENPHLLIRTGTLVIRARAPDGSVPAGLVVGYYSGERTRFLNASEHGVREFADAPLGDLIVAAKAPGYEETQQTRRLLAGVPMEVILKLRPLD